MKHSTYAENAAVEDLHWWYVVRRRLFARVLRRMNLAASAIVVDAGCSTGTNLILLRELGFSNVCGIDMSPEALRWCKIKGFGNVRNGDLCELPLADESVDVLLATDVLEHIDDDDRALTEIHRVLRPGGVALVTVPAFPSLWGISDEIGEHRRRYRMRGLRSQLEAAGIPAHTSYHFNYLLFVPIFLARRLMRLARGAVKNENHLNTRWLNRVLEWVFELDARMAPYLRLPFGISILCVCRKPMVAAEVRPVPACAA